MTGFNFSSYTQQILARASGLAAKERSRYITPHHLLLVLMKIFPERIPAGELSKWKGALEMYLSKLEKNFKGMGTTQYDTHLKKAFTAADRLRVRERDTLIHPKHLWEALIESDPPLIDIKELIEQQESEQAAVEKEQEIPESSILSRLCINFTQKAKLGGLEPVIGRDNEIAQVIQVLLKRKKNNPLLLGEAGVGKTAIIEGIAQQLADAEDIPVLRSLKDKEILGLDLMSLVGGTGVRGELEKRLNELVGELEKNSHRYILFIDEVHNLIGAGKSEGSADLANYLKPALARGEISIIGATTFAEYKRFIEPDAALKRRFEPLMVNEPSMEQTITILQNVQELYQEFHRVEYPSEVLEKIPEWASNYFSETHRPDNAINLMDNLGAYTAQKSEGQEQAIVTPARVSEFISQTKGVDPSHVLLEANERIAQLKSSLAPFFQGQETALQPLFESLAFLGLPNSKRLAITPLLFIGSEESEKLNIAHALAEYLYNEQKKIYSLDLASYTERESIHTLIGPPRGIEGFQDGGDMTEFVKRNPQCCIIASNAEHAHPNVLRLFLEPLRQGTITDSARISYPFHQAMLLVLSNSLDDLRYRHGEELLQLVPSRIFFPEMDTDVRSSLLEEDLQKLAQQYADMGYQLVFEPDLLPFLEKELQERRTPHSPQALQYRLKSLLENPLAAYIVENQVPPGKIQISAQDERPVFQAQPE